MFNVSSYIQFNLSIFPGIGRKFDVEPQPISVPVGGVARFHCQIKAVPPVVYSWERNKTVLPPDNNRYKNLIIIDLQ